jgi:radical SAM protein with 4Fe4S-binding SPASM domain
MSLLNTFDDFHSPAPGRLDGERSAAAPDAIPHVVAWNLTRRCNLACAHCYIAAGPWHGDGDELSLDECRRIADEIFQLNPAPLFILSGGEPLIRDDLEDFARHCTAAGATIVVGTNGTELTDARIASLRAAGVSGFALSIDSLDPRYHDRFRHGEHALAGTLAAVERLRQAQLDFVIQTTLTPGNRHEISRLAEWSAEQGAVCFNLYFLVETGRGEGMRPLSPEENEEVLEELVELGRRFRGRMMVRSKCQPELMRTVHRHDPESPLLHYATRCPCGVQYCRITPEGKVTPCPYMPVSSGDLRQQSFSDVWSNASLFQALRGGTLGGKCGRCEYRGLCGGCRARAFARTGDPLGEDASCAWEPSGEGILPLIRVPERPTYGQGHVTGLEWDTDAEARLRRIPSFVRGVVASRVESWARDHGVTTITVGLMDQIRGELPIDFAKKRPFFARNDARRGEEPKS